MRTIQPIEVLDEDIIFDYNNTRIPVRKTDGYISLTAMAKATNSRINDYLSLKRTIGFLHSLSNDVGIPLQDLVEVRKGGHPTLQGTWGHFKLAYHFAFWADDDFALWVVELIKEYLENGSIEANTVKTVHNATNMALPSGSDFQPPSNSSLTSIESLSPLQQLHLCASISKNVLDIYKEERGIIAGMSKEDRASIVETRMNLADLNRQYLKLLRQSIAPNTSELELSLLSASTTTSYSAKTYTFNTDNDIVSVNQRQQELFLLGEIPQYLSPEQISSVGKRASRSYQQKYKRYPSRIKYMYADGKEGLVNAYTRSILNEIVDPHIKSIFGILSVLPGNKSIYTSEPNDACVI